MQRAGKKRPRYVDAGHREGWPGYYAVVGSAVFGLILFFSFRSHVQAAFALRRTRPRQWQGGAVPRVSLVIPSFNEEAVLRQTVSSVVALD
ncbi:MAG: hypothetical protein IH624_00720 [Phycisphaerae bacterium]|nr:hypothetical protein [Phycisphaerae bacterium]